MKSETEREKKLRLYTNDNICVKELVKRIERLNPSSFYQKLILEKKLKSTRN